MNLDILTRVIRSAADEGSGAASDTTSKSDEIVPALKDAFSGPVPYIVIGAIVLLIVVVYLLRRITKASANTVKVITRKGQIYRLLKEGEKNYFLVPFVDSLGASIPLDEQSFSPSQLLINNGPDALYDVKLVLSYQVVDVEAYFKKLNDFQNLATSKLNDDLREYADKGNALVIVKDYREHNNELLKLFNDSLSSFGIKVNSFKINYVKPIGK